MAFTYEATEVKKKVFKVYVRCLDAGATVWRGGGVGDTWKEVGIFEELPSLKTSEGDNIKVHTGAEMTISENVEFAATLLQVNPDNYAALKDLINRDADIKFEDGSGGSGDTRVTCTEMKLYPALEISGNEIQKVVITAKKETAPGDALNLETIT